MAVITDPPVIIDSSTFSRQSRAEQNPFLFQRAGLQYTVLVPGHVGDNGIAVLLSQDDGSTWTELDAANKPPGAPRNPDVFYNETAGTLEIFYQTGASSADHAIVTFTMAGTSSTWGTPGTSLTDDVSNQCFFVKRSDGVYVLFTINDLGNRVVYYTNTAGVWSGATNIITGSFPFAGQGIKGGILSSTDVAFFSYLDNSGVVKVARVTSAFSVTTSASLGLTTNTNRHTFKLEEGNDRLFVGWCGNQETYVSVGTPLSAPLFTKYTIFSEGGSSQVSYTTLGVGSDGNVVVFFVQVDYGVLPIIDRLWFSAFDGVATWSAPIVYYDETANPPADGNPDPLQQFIHTGDVVLLASGNFLFITALETVDGAVGHCTGFALIPAPPPPGCPTIYVSRQSQPDAPAPPPPPGIPR